MNTLARHFYEFDSFRIDVGDRSLLCDGQNVQLTPKVFEILLALVENSGHALSKNELMDRVWADSFVEEGNINRAISTLRKALGDDPGAPRFIRTLPKLGYSFVGEVKEVWENDETVLVENRTRYHVKLSERVVRRAPIGGFRVAAGLLAGAAVVAGLAFAWNHSQGSELASARAEAVELHEKGRALWQTRAGDKLHEATSLLERAVTRDPSFAQAHASLADAYAFDYTNWKKAEPTAREAIRLDPALGQPHASIGFVRMFWQWRLREAETEFKAALLKSPDYATAHQWYALLLAATARHDAAYSEISTAAVLEPSSPSIGADMCQMFYLLQRYADARGWCGITLAANPDFFDAHRHLYQIHNAEGSYDEAVSVYIKIEKLGIGIDRDADARRAFANGDIKAFWLWRIEQMAKPDPVGYQTAAHYARLGDTERAIAHLYHAYEKRDPDLLLFYADPVFTALRGDRRYEELFHLLYPPR